MNIALARYKTSLIRNSQAVSDNVLRYDFDLDSHGSDRRFTALPLVY